MKNLVIIYLTVLLVSCFMQTGHATQLVSDDEWANGVGITFDVVNKGSFWEYTYRFTGLLELAPQFLKLEVSNVANAWYKLVKSDGTLVTLNPESLTFHLWDVQKPANGFPNPDPLLNTFYAVYIGEETSTQGELADGSITIRSSQGPMWGSFYMRGPHGDPPEVINRGFNGGHFVKVASVDVPSYSYNWEWFDYINPPKPAYNPSDLSPSEYWILVPDTYQTTVPEPATMLLLGSGLIGLAGYGRKKFFKK